MIYSIYIAATLEKKRSPTLVLSRLICIEIDIYCEYNFITALACVNDSWLAQIQLTLPQTLYEPRTPYYLLQWKL